MNSNMPSPELAPPPKFSSLSTGQGPSTVDDWMQFIRWLYQLYVRTAENIGAAQSIAFNFQGGAGVSADSIIGQAQVVRQPQNPSAVLDAFVSQVRAIYQQPVPVHAAAESIPATAPPQQHANELDALTTLALTRTPQRNATGSSLAIEETHANRVANYPAGNYAIGTLFWETDRTVWYLVATVGGVNAWIYASGAMTSTLSPDDRPTDLGTADIGFLFIASDVRCFFQWTGSVWLNVTSPSVQAVVTGSRSLGSTYQNTGANPMFLTVSLQLTTGGTNSGVVDVKTDAVTPPTTIVAQMGTNTTAASATVYSVTFIVLPGNYYLLTLVGAAAVSNMVWTEWQ